MLRVTASLCLSFPDTIALPLPEQVLSRDPLGVSQCQAYLLLHHACARLCRQQKGGGAVAVRIGLDRADNATN